MRIMFTFAGGNGHFEPLLPLARAAAAAGHAVAFVCRPWMVPKVAALGFAAFAAGSDAGLKPERRPLANVDLEKEIQQIGKGFANRIAREQAADILPLCDSWQPDILVCEEIDFGAMIAAERLGLPYATVLVIAAGGFVRPSVVAGPLNDLRAEHGLPPDPELVMLRRHLVLSPFPPSYRDPADPLPDIAHLFRPLALDPGQNAAMPPWITQLDDQPLVYFTLGTVFNMEAGDLFGRVLAGLRDLPINVVVTVGRDIDPAELGPQPANVHIEQFIPQALLLPHCELVVSHAGSGSVIGALAHGLPMVLLPMGADQPLNAARCAALHVAQVLHVLEATPEDVRAAAAAVLQDPSYRQAAERMRDQIAAMPAPEHALMLLEQLATKRRPDAV